ncbi:hypothetical protein [Paraburkholderia azotifigens]|uniref:hypothetical protein n=1 Tax=Paraburkholderia azotifigens TaxID=2057004 RepID=UPI0013158B9E|nr:hypothetical protein [Paraburkholderia azotifigens]
MPEVNVDWKNQLIKQVATMIANARPAVAIRYCHALCAHQENPDAVLNPRGS